MPRAELAGHGVILGNMQSGAIEECLVPRGGYIYPEPLAVCITCIHLLLPHVCM